MTQGSTLVNTVSWVGKAKSGMVKEQIPTAAVLLSTELIRKGPPDTQEFGEARRDDTRH
jgi:hypothetical protein